jgi:hypothetical protein
VILLFTAQLEQIINKIKCICRLFHEIKSLSIIFKILQHKNKMRLMAQDLMYHKY